MASKYENNAQQITVVKYRDDDLASIFLTWFIQVTAVAAAITFGNFSVLSWRGAETAKEQANTANLLALAALCRNVNDQVSSLFAGEPNFLLNFTRETRTTVKYKTSVANCFLLHRLRWQQLSPKHFQILDTSHRPR